MKIKDMEAIIESFKARIDDDAQTTQAVIVQTRAIAELVRTVDTDVDNEDVTTWNWSPGRLTRHPVLNIAKIVSTLTETNWVMERDEKKVPYIAFTGFKADVTGALYLMDLFHTHIEATWDAYRTSPAHAPEAHGKRTGIREGQLRRIGKEFMGTLQQVVREVALTNIRDPEQSDRVTRKRVALAKASTA